MKRLLISAVIVMTLVFSMSITSFAATEKENNDTAKNATKISVNTEITGNLSKNSDVDWFKFEVKESGYFCVDFQHGLIDSSSRYWEIRLFDSTGVNYIDGNSAYFGVPGNSDLITNSMGVQPGTYYIKINDNYYSGTEYTLTVNFTASSDWETENNNSKDKANLISVNKTYNGSLSTDGDVDWYKIQVTEKGSFYVDFQHELLDSSSSYWELRFYDSTGVNYIDGNSAYFRVNGNSNLKTSSFGVEPGTYYIKINDNYYTGRDYTLTVNFTPSSDWETENNNSKDKADLILVNKTYNGSLSTDGDVDFYKFEITENGYFYVDFQHELLDSSSSYWELRFYDSTGVNYIDGNSAYFRVNGNSNMTTNSFGIEPGTYYIKINDNYYTGRNYTLTVNFAASSDWETENNNSKDKADDINVNKPVNGALSTDGDQDWFKFTVDTESEIAIGFIHGTLNSSSTYWELNLYDSTGVTSVYSTRIKGDLTSTTGEYFTIPAGTYYVRITDNYYSGISYTLSVQERHDCQGAFSVTKEPSCTEPGTEEQKCNRCGKVLDSRTVPAKGHVSDNWIVDEEATCSREGKRHADCSVCGTPVTETIPALPHTVGEWTVLGEPDCDTTGSKTRTCSVCGTVENETIPALGHEYGEWVVVSGNKLIPPIVKEKSCVNCNYVETTNDWSYVWVTILAGVVLLGVLIGIINYFKAFRR